MRKVTGKTAKPLGRPKGGKSSNSAYRQVSAWIRRDTYDKVTIRLVQENRREFSEIVQSLLEDWLKERKKDNKRNPHTANLDIGDAINIEVRHVCELHLKKGTQHPAKVTQRTTSGPSRIVLRIECPTISPKPLYMSGFDKYLYATSSDIGKRCKPLAEISVRRPKRSI